MPTTLPTYLLITNLLTYLLTSKVRGAWHRLYLPHTDLLLTTHLLTTRVRRPATDLPTYNFNLRTYVQGAWSLAWAIPVTNYLRTDNCYLPTYVQ
eukprot:scaffold61979_cov50-Phaeocystis_antarctica.AAC.2